jgi:syntaxin 1B/2/3
VKARQNDLARIETTLVELAGLFHELETMVAVQENVVESADTNAAHVVENMEQGNNEIKQANDHARRRRKLQWWCLLITILIIVIVVGVAVGVLKANGTIK